MALALIIEVWKRNNRQVPHWRNVNKQTKITKTMLLQPLKSENGLKSSAMMTPMPRQKIWRLMLRIAPPPLRGRRAWGCMFKVLGVTPQPQVHVATRMNPAFVAEGWQLLCSFAPPHLWMFTGKWFVIKPSSSWSMTSKGGWFSRVNEEFSFSFLGYKQFFNTLLCKLWYKFIFLLHVQSDDMWNSFGIMKCEGWNVLKSSYRIKSLFLHFTKDHSYFNSYSWTITKSH